AERARSVAAIQCAFSAVVMPGLPQVITIARTAALRTDTHQDTILAFIVSHVVFLRDGFCRCCTSIWHALSSFQLLGILRVPVALDRTRAGVGAVRRRDHELLVASVHVDWF